MCFVVAIRPEAWQRHRSRPLIHVYFFDMWTWISHQTHSAHIQLPKISTNMFGTMLYNFTATHYQNTGYVIDAINNVPYTITHQSPSMCFWKFIVQYPTGSEIPPYEGISKYTFDSDGFGVIMRYQSACPPPNDESKKLKNFRNEHINSNSYSYCST